MTKFTKVVRDQLKDYKVALNSDSPTFFNGMYFMKYLDSVNGDDNNSGDAANEAWKTLTKYKEWVDETVFRNSTCTIYTLIAPGSTLDNRVQQ